VYRSRFGFLKGVGIRPSKPLVAELISVSPIKRLQWVVAGAVGTIAAILLALFLWQYRRSVDSTSPAAIAVLPFQNASSNKDADFLQLALPDEIANTLSYVRSFSIRPFATTSKFNGPNVNLKQAGREMGVTSIVTGHYLLEGNQLEITLEAVDVANNRTVWRDTINVPVSDKIAMREQVTARVRQGLVPALGGSSASGTSETRPKNEEAYDLYLRSIAVPHNALPNKNAITMLESAVAMDPTYAPAWEALGLRYYFDASYGDGGEQMLRRSDSAYERALELDPNRVFASAQAITNRADEGDLVEAYEAALKLVKRRPESGLAHFALAYLYRYAGLLEESARECDTALSLDPGNFTFRSCSWAFMQLNRPQRAMEFARLDAGSEYADRQTAYILMGQGRLAEARQSIQRTSDNLLMGRDRDLIQYCLDPRHQSELNEAARKIETATLAGIDAEPRYTFGTMLSYCGEHDAALRLLRSAIHQNYCAYSALQSDPLLVRFRRTPEFSELLSDARECQNEFLAHRDQGPR